MGAYTVALRYCQKALAACQPDPGSFIYYLSLAHRAHLLFDLGRRIEAKADMELASIADFPAVKSALESLRIIMGESSASDVGNTLRTWQERLDVFRADGKDGKLSPVEERLLHFLSSGAREKFEIADHLFGRDLHPLKAENRIKNLVHRIRKKFPGLIVFEQDRYFLADGEAGKAAGS
jgi:hypothetical protein